MICVNVFYPAAGDGRFDLTYYKDKHLPLVQRLLGPHGLTRIEVDEGLSGFSQGIPPNYRVICRLYFPTAEAFQAAFAAAVEPLLADLPHFTDIPVEVQVSNSMVF